jgi:hypothetical protein
MQDLDHSAALIAASPRCDLRVFVAEIFVIVVATIVATFVAE